MHQSNNWSLFYETIDRNLSLEEELVNHRLFEPLLPAETTKTTSAVKPIFHNRYMLPYRKRILLIAPKLQIDEESEASEHSQEASSSRSTSMPLQKRIRELRKFSAPEDQFILTEWRSLAESGMRMSAMTLQDAGNIAIAMREQIGVSFTDKQVFGRMCCLRQFFDRALDRSIRGLIPPWEETKAFRYFKQMQVIYPMRRQHRADRLLRSDRKIVT